MHATAPHTLSQQSRNSTQKRKFALLILLLFLLVVVFGGYIVFTSTTTTNTIGDKNGLFVTELEHQEDERRTTTLTIKKKRKAKERQYDEIVAKEHVPISKKGGDFDPNEYFIHCNRSKTEEDGAASLGVEKSSGFSSNSKDASSSSMLYQYDARKDVKHIVNAIHEATLNKDPFKSAYFCDILPEDLYDDMNAYFPPAYALMKDQRANAGQVGRKDADKRYKCSAFDILKLRDEKKWGKVLRAKKVWERATKALYSPSVKLALFMKFKISKKPASRDFRVQSDAGGFSIGTHPDNRKKILTFQLYLPQDANEESSVYTYGTCLHTPEQHKLRDKIDGSAPCEKKMAFVANTAYAFPVTRSSFHSVENVVGKSKGARKTIMLNWYTHVMDGAQSMGGGLLSLLAG